ncbi:hypothetical protein ACS5PK_08225 [Roseateles sp. DB2]|uniref:hypothetical protein n=1 Tax=Roseateles sp. DB2 TaxID=3453717 RepID=UPI003EEC31C5
MKSILTLSLASLLALPALAQQAQGIVQPAAPLVTPQPAVAPAVAGQPLQQQAVQPPVVKTKKAHKKSAAAGKKSSKKVSKKTAGKPHKAGAHAKVKASHKRGKSMH